MIDPKFDRDRIIQDAKELGAKVREVAPGEGGVFIREEDGSEREVTTFDLFPEAKEIADLRCAVAGLIAENERLKAELAKATELLSKSQDVFYEWDMYHFPICEEIGLYLKKRRTNR